MKIEKISSRVLLVCVAVIIVCFGAFMTIGYDNPVGDNNQPLLTDVILGRVRKNGGWPRRLRQ